MHRRPGWQEKKWNEGTDVAQKTVLIYKEPKDLKMEEEQVLGASEYTYLTDSS